MVINLKNLLSRAAFASLFFVSSTLYSDQPAAPVGLKANFSPGQTSALVNITLHCYAIEKFTRGTIYLLISPDSGVTADSVVLWKGNSNSEIFQRSISHTFKSKKGIKSAVKAVFQCQFVGSTTAMVAGGDYFLLHLADTILIDRGSYGGLEDEEIRYELKKGGYDNLREDQLRIINPKLWKRIKKHRGQIRND